MAQVVINELMSSNSGTVLDEDGETSDWFEVYNSGAAGVDLGGCGITDDEDPFKWRFPPISIPPGGHLLVFASGKDRTDTAAHWETVIDWGDEWKYLIPTSEPSAAWRGRGFDDGAWTSGQTGIGYGDGDDRAVVPAGTISVYARKRFQVADPASVTHAFLDVDFDDGFVAFLNGVEVVRARIADRGRPPTYQEVADSFTEPVMVFGGRPFHYPIANPGALLQVGENVLAIQLHNSDATSSDLTLIPFLTLGMEAPPAGARGLAEILREAVPSLHTSFRLSPEETLTLSSPGGTALDTVFVGPLPTDISQGRFPDGAAGFSIHDQPTPGAPNTTPGYTGISGRADFSHEGGFYPGPLSLTLWTEDPTGTLYFTLDGSVPTTSSTRYASPIAINATTVVRARVLEDGALPGATATHTFIIADSFDLPVVSIATDPANFFDNTIGIYVLGDTYEAAFPHFGANFWEDWERPVHLELYEPDGTVGFRAGAGAKIFGGWSRGNPQRSLSLFARKEYGPTEFRHRIFPQKDLESYEAFVLRNSGNDWQDTHFRDGMMTSLLEDLSVDRTAFRPSAVFINGAYWGILNLREKVNEHYLEANHDGVDSDSIDLLEGNAVAIHGDAQHYQALMTLVSNNTIDAAVYEQVKTMMDVENFIDYEASQIYFDNKDWPGNNIKFWRPRTADGQWRWILFDTDFGFGMWNVNNFSINTLAFALEPNGPSWPNPPWSTLLLRRLVTNPQFVEDFVNRFATHLNTIFLPAKVIARINEMEAAVAFEMPSQKQRWGGSMTDWRSKVQILRTFATNRVANVRNHLTAGFGLGSASTLRLGVSPPASGAVEVQGLEIAEYPWAGSYFRNFPIRLTAVPRPGFRFVGWTGITPPDQATASVVLTGSSLDVSASFEIDCDSQEAVVVNEINYNAAGAADPGDWVELYNQSLAEVDLSGWMLRDEAHTYTFPAGTRLSSRAYLVLCADAASFAAAFPGVTNRLGDLGYSLEGNGELLELLDGEGGLVDSVLYEDDSPWPEEPDGTGATLALKNPLLGNEYAGHWAGSAAGGTPGSENDVFEDVGTDCYVGGSRFIRGDCNGDGSVDISDAFCTLVRLAGDRTVPCVAAVDVNSDAQANVTDSVDLLNYLFQFGSQPAAPFPRCGGPAAGDLECDASLDSCGPPQ